MTDQQETSKDPGHNELEHLFVNNLKLIELETYLKRFNPIRVMKMENMEIRHSAILGWLLDPTETHGLDDQFLKAFLSEALKNHHETNEVSALGILDADLRQTRVLLEWKNIDIFVECQTKKWAFIIENKFHSTQSKGQLKNYLETAKKTYQPPYKVRGIFLTLLDEIPEDTSYATINYADVSNLLEIVLQQNETSLSTEVAVFIRHYLNILKEATGMNDEEKSMQLLAKDLYLEHKKVLDFIVEHGSNSDFSASVNLLFGENKKKSDIVEISRSEYYFNQLGRNLVSFLPQSWAKALEPKDVWSGCEKWWAGYPLIMWVQLHKSNDGKDGTLRLYAEVGPLDNFEDRKRLIEQIDTLQANNMKIKFNKAGLKEGAKYSRFFKNNSIKVEDIHDAEIISTKIEEIIKKFQPEIREIAKTLEDYSPTNSSAYPTN